MQIGSNLTPKLILHDKNMINNNCSVIEINIFLLIDYNF